MYNLVQLSINIIMFFICSEFFATISYELLNPNNYIFGQKLQYIDSIIRNYNDGFTNTVCYAGTKYSNRQTFKQNLRNIFSLINPMNYEINTKENLNISKDGIEIINGNKYLGIAIDTSYFNLLPIIWSENFGLLEQIKRINGILEGELNNFQNQCYYAKSCIIAAVNGTFYSHDAVLGQVIVNSQIPTNIKQQVSNKYPKACLIVLTDSFGNQKVIVGETSFTARQILNKWQQEQNLIKCFSYLNSNIDENYKLLHLLGGAGWIIRGGKDVHMDAYNRQNFRFKKENQDARHTVVATSHNNKYIYFIVFENGLNLSKIADILLNKFNTKITDAIFYDGGSSSTIVFNNAYLVKPLYFIDKARFTAIGVVRR